MRPVAAAGLDALAVLVFVSIGRHAHDHGTTLGGMANTAWPFLVGAAVGWLVARAWRSPAAVIPTGLLILFLCVALGMVLRLVSGQGSAPAFVGVALGFLGLEMLGWRLVVRIPVRLARRRQGA
ncbi:MAG: hypothetical protein JWM85_561 [Acidimicrobiaceae bacterium]|nr:hypothetical protein [Acidimicrobiaceae bacterium]